MSLYSFFLHFGKPVNLLNNVELAACILFSLLLKTKKKSSKTWCERLAQKLTGSDGKWKHEALDQRLSDYHRESTE